MLISLLKGANLHVTIPHAWLKMETNGWPWPIGVPGTPLDGSWPDLTKAAATKAKTMAATMENFHDPFFLL